MGVGDWITLGAVIVALGIGVASILHTQKLQKQERKERLLNEIIEWAVEVNRCGSEIGLQIVPGLTEKYQKRLIRINWAFRYQAINSKSEYIVSLGQATAFKKERLLHTSLKTITEKIEEVTNLLWELSKSEDDKEKELSSKVTEQEKLLQEYAIKLVKETVKIKTKDIR